MKICAALGIMQPSRLAGRWANAKPSYSGQAPCAAPDGHGGSVSKATRRARGSRPELRRALRDVGRQPLDVAGEPGTHAPLEEVETLCRALRRRHQLPLSAADGSVDDARADQLAMGRP